MKNIAVVLVVVGIMMMAITGLNYASRTQLIDAGSLQVSVKENHPIEWSPYVGGALLATGLVLLISSKNSLKSS